MELQLPPAVIAVNDRAAALAAPGATITAQLRSPAGRVAAIERPVDPSPLAASFWKLVFTGLFAGIVGLWVGTLRPNVPAALALAVSGFGLLLAAYPVGVILNSQLLLSGTLWLNLMRANYLGIQLFASSIVFVFSVHPVRLMPVRVALVLASVPLAAMAAVAFSSYALGPRFADHTRIVMVDLLVILGLAAGQWRRTRTDPVGRAFLRLVGASAALATGG